MKKERWVWMPHPAHLIVGDKCIFHLATYVGKYIVSTVGEYWAERGVREIYAQVHDPEWIEKNKELKGDNFDVAYFKRFGYEEIGCNRLYETMVFKAQKRKYDSCCPYEIVYGELECKGYNKPEDAFKGHVELCKKWAAK